MTNKPSNRYSLDGFVPSGQNRHVGFDAPRARQSNAASSASHRIRMRRPGLHGSSQAASRNPLLPPVQTPSSVAPGVAKRQAVTQQASGFRSYTSASGSFQSPDEAPAGRIRPAKQSRRQRRRAEKAAAKRRGANGSKTGGWKKILKRTAAGLAVIALLFGGWMGWQFFENSRKVFGGDANLLGFLNSKKLRGEDRGQVNILLAGVSTDDPDHAGAALADSIMLVTLDTKSNKAVMFSIPRDLWVEIPGYGYSKINATTAYGDQDNFSQSGYPSGGMGLLAKTVNNNFEIPVDYYAKVNYGAFRDAVNAVGGITVNIQSDDPRGLYDPNISKPEGGPLKLSNGPQQLDGQTALNLARARGNPPGDGRFPYGFERSDFTRTQHQRQMLLALKEKVSSSSVISNPLKIGELFDVVGKNLKTDFEPSEIRRLYDINKQVKASDIASLSLNDVNGKNLLASYRTPEGQSALIPAAGLDDYSDIQLAIKKALSSDPVVKEAAKVVILNGGDVTGLATRESNALTAKGINVVAVGDAPRTVGANLIIDATAKNGKSAKPGTIAKLKSQYQATVKTTNDYGYPSADIIIVLGTNHRGQQSSSPSE